MNLAYVLPRDNVTDLVVLSAGGAHPLRMKHPHLTRVFNPTVLHRESLTEPSSEIRKTLEQVILDTRVLPTTRTENENMRPRAEILKEGARRNIFLFADTNA